MIDQPKGVPDADDIDDPTTADARRAVDEAARRDGATVVRGAFQAKRTWAESEDAFSTYDPRNVVILSLRQAVGGHVVGVFPVRPHHEVRDDWTHPTPDDHSPGDYVLPPEDFDLDDIFVAPAGLPGGWADGVDIEDADPDTPDIAEPDLDGHTLGSGAGQGGSSR